MPDFEYVGSELEIFAHAANWKKYVRSKLGPYLTGDVLEVGAGLGGATQFLCDGTQRRWVCLEPDSKLAQQLEQRVVRNKRQCEVAVGTLANLNGQETFDSILYMDVLEHIEEDRAELLRAAQHLKPGGALMVLSPAIPWLYSPFDAAIGHYRRYTKQTLRAAAPKELKEEQCIYLDSVGFLASAGNRLFLRSAAPSLNQILLWDRLMVPPSRFVDLLIGYSIGRSLLGVWCKS
jgi:SAM-dependent methyltransferase